MSVQQERFNESVVFVNDIIRLITNSLDKAPEYGSDTRARDEFLLKFARSESLLSSVLSYAVAKQKAAPWLLTGSKRQVGIYSRMLHNAHRKGWRTWLSLQATAFYSTNIGFVSEIEFNSNGLPANIYAIDSTRCRLNNNLDKPVTYYPTGGRSRIELEDYEVLQANSMPSLEEKMVYAGFCATERALQFARMSLAINQNHLETLGAIPPKQIMLLKGINGNDWKKAVEKYEEDKANKSGMSYDGTFVVSAANSEADIKSYPLSTLPVQFDIVKYAETLVNGICAAYGVPPFNVWAMSTGSFGRGAEAQVANQEASRSGAMEFIASMQEELSRKVLPTTVKFTFDLNGSAIRKIENSNDTEMIKQLALLYNSRGSAPSNFGNQNQEGSDVEDSADNETTRRNVEDVDDDNKPILSRKEIRQLLALENYIPHDWTETAEDVTVTDIQMAREVTLENPNIRKAAKFYHNEPIIQYLGNVLPDENVIYKSKFRNNIDIDEDLPPNGKAVVLWETGNDMIKKRIY